MQLDKDRVVFPYGSHLCREPMPDMAELLADMENLKAHGFNMVKLQESWFCDEPEEGKYDFTVSHQLVSHAEKLGLGVYYGLSMEHAPAWVWEKYPDCTMVGKNGEKIAYQAQLTIPADGKPGPCFDHDGAMQAHLVFIDKLVRELSVHKNIWVWNTWQEMGIEAKRITGHDACYCAQTLAAFRRWLQGEFGNLDALNRCWKSRYSQWAQIVPNRDAGRFCLPNNIYYHYFLDNVRLPRILQRRYEAIRAADPQKRPVFCHQGSSTVGSGKDWAYARQQDFFGTSCYPAWFHIHGWDDLANETAQDPAHASLLNEMWESVSLKFDYLRGCAAPDMPLWGAEFQGGPIATGLYKGRVPSPADIRRWVLTAVGAGATGISFWVTRAEIQGHENNGYSLLDSAGDTTPRYEEAARIGQALNRWPVLFGKRSTPNAQVGILVNEWNYELCTQLKDDADEHLMYATRGWHRLFWQQGIFTDFVELNIATAAQLAQYPLLVLPFPLSLSEKMAEKLQVYVKNGGHLVTDACPGRFTQSGFAARGELPPILAQLFGAQQAGLSMVKEPGGNRWSMPEYSLGDYQPAAKLDGTGILQGVSLNANLYLQTLKCTTAQPVLTHKGQDAAALNHFGKGQALLLGTFVGHSGTAYRDENTNSLIDSLTRWAKVPPPHPGELLVRQRAAGNVRALFVTNPTAASLTESIDTAGAKSAQTLFGQPVKLTENHATLTVQPLDVEVLVLES